MRKHVYILNEGCRGSAYGVGTYIKQLAECLKDMDNLLLHVVHLNSNEEQCEVLTEKGYDELLLPRNNLMFNGKYDRYCRHIWYLIRLHIKIAEGDVVYFLLNYVGHQALIPLMREQYPGCRIYFVIHFQEWCFALNGNLSGLKKIVGTMDKEELTLEQKAVFQSFEKEQKTYRLVDKVICLARFTESVLWEVYKISPEKTTLIYNGLKDDANLYPLSSRDALREQLGFEQDENIILFVGRLDPIKGVKLLIRSFLLLLNELPNSRLVLVGDGNFSIHLKECDRHWNKVVFTGRLEKERLYQLYRIADVGVLPSMHEQCSYTAIEMMMFGLPLIASTTTGLKEMVTNEELLFDMIDEDDSKAKIVLSGLLKKVLISSQKIKDLNTKMRMTYEEKYLLEVMKENIIKSLFCEYHKEGCCNVI